MFAQDNPDIQTTKYASEWIWSEIHINSLNAKAEWYVAFVYNEDCMSETLIVREFSTGLSNRVDRLNAFVKWVIIIIIIIIITSIVSTTNATT